MGARAALKKQPAMALETPSRRSAVLTAATALAVIPLQSALAAEDLNDNAKSAYVGGVTDKDCLAGNDDAMAAIARRTAEANAAAARSKGYGKTNEELRAEQEEAKGNIIKIALGGTVASTAFFYQNLARLFTKITSGGQDSGYGTASDQAFRKAKAGKKVGKASAKQMQNQKKDTQNENFFLKLAKAANPQSNFK